MSAITITKEAQEQIEKMLAKNPNALGLKLGTSKYGCSGLGYTIDYVEDPNADDELVEVGDIKIWVDRKSLLFILGTEMGYEDSMFSTGFIFKNPNEKSRCGCGESFMV